MTGGGDHFGVAVAAAICGTGIGHYTGCFTAGGGGFYALVIAVGNHFNYFVTLGVCTAVTALLTGSIADRVAGGRDFRNINHIIVAALDGFLIDQDISLTAAVAGENAAGAVIAQPVSGIGALRLNGCDTVSNGDQPGAIVIQLCLRSQVVAAGGSSIQITGGITLYIECKGSGNIAGFQGDDLNQGIIKGYCFAGFILGSSRLGTVVVCLRGTQSKICLVCDNDDLIAGFQGIDVCHQLPNNSCPGGLLFAADGTNAVNIGMLAGGGNSFLRNQHCITNRAVGAFSQAGVHAGGILSCICHRGMTGGGNLRFAEHSAAIGAGNGGLTGIGTAGLYRSFCGIGMAALCVQLFQRGGVICSRTAGSPHKEAQGLSRNIAVNTGVTAPVLVIVDANIAVGAIVIQIAAGSIDLKCICGVGANTDTVIGACTIQPRTLTARNIENVSTCAAAHIPFQVIIRSACQLATRNSYRSRSGRLGSAVVVAHGIICGIILCGGNHHGIAGFNAGCVGQYIFGAAAGAGNHIGVYCVERNIFLCSVHSIGSIQGRHCLGIADSAGGPADEGIAVLAVIIGSNRKLVAGVDAGNSTYLTGYREADGSKRIVTILANAVHIAVTQCSDYFCADGLAAVVTGDGHGTFVLAVSRNGAGGGIGVLTGGRGSLIVDSHSIAAAHLGSHAGDGEGIGGCSGSNGDLVTACRSGSTCTLGGVHQSTCIGTAAAKKLDLRNITQRAFNDQLRLCIQPRGCIVRNIAGRTGLIVCQFNAIFFPNLIAGAECGTVA